MLVTGNMFGDILSDVAAMLTGSLGMLPSASLAADGSGMYEPVHGSAPDIAGQDKANPLATILSVAMMCRYSLDAPAAADAIDAAVDRVLAPGIRTPDIAPEVRDRGIPRKSKSLVPRPWAAGCWRNWRCSMSDGYDVAVVGATGAVGEALMEILAEREFPVRTTASAGQ